MGEFYREDIELLQQLKVGDMVEVLNDNAARIPLKGMVISLEPFTIETGSIHYQISRDFVISINGKKIR